MICIFKNKKNGIDFKSKSDLEPDPQSESLFRNEYESGSITTPTQNRPYNPTIYEFGSFRYWETNWHHYLLIMEPPRDHDDKVLYSLSSLLIKCLR